jgi:hypothetical protein
MKCIFISKIIVFNLVVFLTLFLGCSSGKCKFINIISCSGNYRISETDGKFSELQINAEILGNSDPECTFTLNGSGMLEYTFDKIRQPDLLCDKSKKFNWIVTCNDLKRLDGKPLATLPGDIYLTLDYGKWKQSAEIKPILQNGCKVDPPPAPKLTPGNFVNDGNNCYCPLTIEFDKVPGCELFLKDGSSTIVNSSGETVVATAQKITTMLEKGSVSNQYIYKWVPTTKVIHYLQVSLVLPGKYACTESDPSYSSALPIDNIPCIDPTIVKIVSITKADSTVVGSSEALSPSSDGPYKINVNAIGNNGEIPGSITVEISYDNTKDTERATFYNVRNPGTTILRTIVLNPPSKREDNIYSIDWNGKDGFDNRILLGGEYEIKVTAKFVAKTVSCSQSIKITKPVVLNTFGDYAPGHKADVDAWKAEYASNLYTFVDTLNEPVLPFLMKSPDENFEWIREHSRVGKQAADLISDYKVVNWGTKLDTSQSAIKESDVQFKKKNIGIFSYMGHAGYASPTDPACCLLYPKNNMWASNDGGRCTSVPPGPAPNVCVNYDCSKNVFKIGTMDNVLLAVLVGCNTDRTKGAATVANNMMYQGADCTIGTGARVRNAVFQFWYYRFYEQLFKNKETISDAARKGWDEMIKDIAKFYEPIKDDATFEKVQEFFDDDLENPTGMSLEEFSITIQIKDNPDNPKAEKVSLKSIYPVRFGACKNP